MYDNRNECNRQKEQYIYSLRYILSDFRENRKIYNSKIIGNICMDLTMIYVSEVENVEVGDRVIVLDNAEKMANELSTISYEILTNFSKLRV